MTKETEFKPEPEHVLTLERVLDVPVEKIWRCWTEPALLKQWFCPRPWQATGIRIDLRPGGEFSIEMNGPDGETFASSGVFLDVEPGRRLVFTDAFLPGWVPSKRAFMTAEARFEDAGEGKTRYFTRAMHWDKAALEDHERMGFRENRGTCIDQLEVLAGSLRSAEPATSPVRGVGTCLWFDNQALPAAEFYCALLPDSQIERIARYPEGQAMGEPGAVLTVEFSLSGTPYTALNGGPHFTLDEAVSITVTTENQAETDRLWNALIAGGGAESRCGWLKDRFGLSWQIVPKRAVDLLNGPTASKVWPALLQMRKIDLAVLEAAADAG